MLMMKPSGCASSFIASSSRCVRSGRLKLSPFFGKLIQEIENRLVEVVRAPPAGRAASLGIGRGRVRRTKADGRSASRIIEMARFASA